MSSFQLLLGKQGFDDKYLGSEAEVKRLVSISLTQILEKGGNVGQRGEQGKEHLSNPLTS